MKDIYLLLIKFFILIYIKKHTLIHLNNYNCSKYHYVNYIDD